MKPTDPSNSKISAHKLAKSIIVATLLGVAVFAGLSIYSDVQQLRANLAIVTYRTFVFALLLASGNYFVRYLRWQYYLRHIGISVPNRESATVFLAGFVMSITPGKFGEVFKSLLLYESRGLSIAKTAPVVVAERLTDLMALVILIAIGSLSFREGITITITGGIVVGFILTACAYRPLGEWFIHLIETLPITRRFAPKLREAYESLLEMTRIAPLIAGTTAGVISWGMECAALYVIVMGFGTGILSWNAATFAYSTSTMAGALAMMPGGLGITEIGMVELIQALGNKGMTLPLATAATILVRIATLWYAVIIGLGALGFHRAIKPIHKNNQPIHSR